MIKDMLYTAERSKRNTIQGWKAVTFFIKKRKKLNLTKFLFHEFLCILYFPAFIFHELCHIIVNFSLGNKMTKFDWQFLVYHKKSKALVNYQLIIDVESSNHFYLLLGTIAPLIGWIVLVCVSYYSLFFHASLNASYWFNILFYLYVFWGGKWFMISEDDRKTIKFCWNKTKII